MAKSPKLTEHDKVALASLIARYVEAWDTRAHNQRLASKIALRITEHNAKLSGISAAFQIYGFDTKQKEVWDQIRETIGDDLFDGAYTAGRVAAVQGGVEYEAEEEDLEEEEEEAVEKKEEEKPEAPAQQASSHDRPTVRNALLARLEAIAPRGAKAAELRTFLETTFGMKLHEKTCGMSLYRLSQDGLVRRDGRTWFFVPHTAETKNPGVAAPGSSNQTLL